MGAAVAGSMLKPSFASKRAARSMRTGSSRKRVSGSPISRRRRAAMSSDTADVVPDREVGDVVVERVGGEIAPPDVLVDRAVDVVAQDASGRIEHALDESSLSPLRRAGEPAAAARRLQRPARRAPAPRRPPGRHPAAAPRPGDGALAARKVATSMISRPKKTCARRKRRPTRRQLRNSRLTCFGQRIGGDVEILRLHAEQQVAHAAADQERHGSPHRAGGRAPAARWARYGSGKSCARIAG